MDKKALIVLLVITVAVLIYFQDTEKINNHSNTAAAELLEMKQEVEQLKKHNIQMEEKMDDLRIGLFHTKANFVRLDEANVFLFGAGVEVIHKYFGDFEYAVYLNDMEGRQLIINKSTLDSSVQLSFEQLDRQVPFSHTSASYPDSTIQGGYFDPSRVEAVYIKINDESKRVTTYSVNETTGIWYVVIEGKRKRVGEEPDMITIEAYDGEDNLIFEESHPVDQGG